MFPLALILALVCSVPKKSPMIMTMETCKPICAPYEVREALGKGGCWCKNIFLPKK